MHIAYIHLLCKFCFKRNSFQEVASWLLYESGLVKEITHTSKSIICGPAALVLIATEHAAYFSTDTGLYMKSKVRVIMTLLTLD